MVKVLLVLPTLFAEIFILGGRIAAVWSVLFWIGWGIIPYLME
jgi:hypothetical protein